MTGPNHWLAQVTATGGAAWLLSDYQGSVRLVVGLTGGVQDQVNYDAFGNITSETNPSQGSLLKFQGGQYDSVTETYQFGARVYGPASMRWNRVDPMGFGGGQTNLYEAMGNAPTDGTDPSGKFLIAQNEKALDAWRQWFKDNNISTVGFPLPARAGTFSNYDQRWYIYVAPGQASKVQDAAEGIQGLNADALIRTTTMASRGAYDSSYSTSYEVSAGSWRLNPTSLTQKEEVRVVQADQEEELGQAYLTSAEIPGVDYGAAFAEGYHDGSVIVANQLTFKMIPSLNEEASRLIQENGGAYVWADVAGEVARESLVQAATLGAGSIASGVSSVAAKVPGLAKVGRGLLQAANLAGKIVPTWAAEGAAWLACKLVTVAHLAKPVLVANQIRQIGLELIQAWAASQDHNNAEVVRHLERAGFSSIGLKQGIKDSLNMAKILRTEGFVGLWKRLSACFGAGTPLRTPEGSMFIEEFVPGDLILSRNEFDPNGPVEVKIVEAVFMRTGQILVVRVDGQQIRTTPEHPFWTTRKGWTQAIELVVGDQLLDVSGNLVLVEEVADTGKFEPVYNLSVVDFHTYFVERMDGVLVSGHTTRVVRSTTRRRLKNKQRKWKTSVLPLRGKPMRLTLGVQLLRQRKEPLKSPCF